MHFRIQDVPTKNVKQLLKSECLHFSPRCTQRRNYGTTLQKQHFYELASINQLLSLLYCDNKSMSRRTKQNNNMKINCKNFGKDEGGNCEFQMYFQ